jgi:hypothetical protein
VAQRRSGVTDIACKTESFNKVGCGGAGVFIIWCALDDLLLVLLFIIVAFFDRRQDFLNLEHGIQRL